MDRFDRGTLSKLLSAVIEVAYPPRCAGCGLRGRWVCEECLSTTPLFDDPRCPFCSMPSTTGSCDCRALPERVDRLWVAGPYDGWLRSAVHAFKFNGETSRAAHFASLLERTCASFGVDTALVPVPLHPKRKRQRGYEQTTILAQEIAMRTGQPVFTGLRKARNTAQQVGLSRAERSLNLLGAFELVPEAICPGDVLLIDDVATTGATLTECALALRTGGATQVSAVVIAHGL